MGSSAKQFTSIGGQAVMEGVMMRSPHVIAVAVRRANQKIVLRNRSYQGFASTYPLLKKPIFRGVCTLLESMIQGFDALTFSANIAAESEGEKELLSDWAMVGFIATALGVGIALFVALPHLLTVGLMSLTGEADAQRPSFHLIDGLFKVGILLGYVYLIGLMQDIHRVFQYHGAEHKTIYTFEAGEDLTVENARKYTTLHPRCGTSFLFFLILISIIVFSVVFPIFGLTELTSSKALNHILMVLIKVLLMFPVAGLAYEFIKVCAFRMDSPVFRTLIWPGMILQKLTTREPTDDQLEVALASMRQVLYLEKNLSSLQEQIEISSLADLAPVPAQVAEFPEV